MIINNLKTNKMETKEIIIKTDELTKLNVKIVTQDEEYNITSLLELLDEYTLTELKNTFKFLLHEFIRNKLNSETAGNKQYVEIFEITRRVIESFEYCE